MAEIYTIQVEKSRLCFTSRSMAAPDCVLSPTRSAVACGDGLSLVCRMGDPELLQCIVFRRDNKPGGIFAVHDRNGLLFAAVADDNLAFALAQGFFGEMAANARYGVDIFENLDGPDD